MFFGPQKSISCRRSTGCGTNYVCRKFRAILVKRPHVLAQSINHFHRPGVQPDKLRTWSRLLVLKQSVNARQNSIRLTLVYGAESNQHDFPIRFENLFAQAGLSLERLKKFRESVAAGGSPPRRATIQIGKASSAGNTKNLNLTSGLNCSSAVMARRN
jgi:hypothetical protein